MNTVKNKFRFSVIGVVFSTVLIAPMAMGGNLTLPKEWVANDPLTADELNGNFKAVEVEVNENSGRVTNNAMSIVGHENRITANEKGVANNTDNITINTNATNRNDARITQNESDINALGKTTTQHLGLGDVWTNPALNCLDLKTDRPSIGDGVYWVKPASAKSSFRIFCDMTTDGGGWSLVWSNLRGGRGKVVTELQWHAAINTAPRYRGEPSADLESYEVFVGLKYWLELAPGNQKRLRYDWASDYQIPLDQRYTCPFTLDSADFYRIDFVVADCVQSVGSIPPGLVTIHNNMKFSTYDKDNDTEPTLNCSATYTNTPWWYKNCWNGNINGGGESSGEGHFNGAYWTGAALIWGTVDGLGAGNGWIFIR